MTKDNNDKDDVRIFRLRMPPELKQWLAIAAAEIDTTQQQLAISILRRFAENPQGMKNFKLPRRTTKPKILARL